MGERKGQNFYYPPDFDYKKHKSLNRYHGTHALRERASKIDQGILVIRFEMPFNIWCLGCENHVGMGVRYNAEKKKIGMYYTTPLYEFRMKCHLCDNYYVIRTDPKNFDYELVDGCRRQENRFDPTTIDNFAPEKGLTQKLAADAMFKKEHEEGDRAKAATEDTRVEKMEWVQERMRDDFSANSFLRAQFRKEKKTLSDQRVRDDDLRGKLSISTTKLLAENEQDRKIASMITRYKDVKTHDDVQSSSRERIDSRRIFANPSDFDPQTPSTSTPSSGSSGGGQKASERLKMTMKMERDKRINEQFSVNIGPKRANPSTLHQTLGIVIRPKKEKIEEEPKEDQQEPKEDDPPANAMSLLQQYSSSSDSD